MIIKLLNTKGIHSELARDGQEAVDLFSAHGPYHYQAVLMDLMMPVKNGEDAAREIRALNQEDAEEIPIIALTADVMNHVEERCREAGISAVIAKPIDPARLFSLLTDAFQS